jgi:iron(III) transport system permease protein
MGRLLNVKQITLAFAAAILVAVGVLPLCGMIGASFSVHGALSGRNYIEVLGNARTWALFRNSLLLATLTTIVVAFAGVTLGVLVAKTDLPLRSTLVVAFSLPLVFPPYILAVGWFELLGRGGLLARWFDIATGSAWLFALPGVLLVLATAFLPVVLLLTITYIRGVDPALEEAARLSGGWSTVLRGITIPLAAPGILLGLVLVFLLTMGEFGAPAFLRFEVFPVASFTQFSAFYNFGAATAAAMPLVLVSLAGLFVEERLLHAKGYEFGWRLQPNSSAIPLGRAKPFVFLLVLLLACLLVCAPLSALLWRGLSPGALAEAVHRAGDSAVRSLLYSGASASVLAVLGFLLAYMFYGKAIFGWRSIDALLLFLFTLPGTVIGIGLIVLWNRPATNWIYATPAMLVLGYVAQYAVLSARTILAGLSQVSPSLEEAAAVAGAGWFRRVFLILLPVLRPVIVLSWTVTFIFCLRDVSLPLLLASPGHDTLTARTMTLMANGSPELIAALCLLSIALALVALAVLGTAWRVWSRTA